MSKPKPKFYVVWKGNAPGVYNSWKDCEKQVKGFEGAQFMSFPNPETAQKAFGKSYWEYAGKNVAQKDLLVIDKKKGSPVLSSISVDAACSGNPGVLEYRGVYTNTGKEIFHRGPFPLGTTNIGEFLAIVTGLAWLEVNNLDQPLYSDSVNGIKWTKIKKVNTKLERNKDTEELFVLIDKALEWLHNHSPKNQILKWETALWGEIPADFGRK